MKERIAQEVKLLRKYFPALEYREDGHWFLIPAYPLPDGWNRKETDVAFQLRLPYPGTPPYGIYAPAGLTFDGALPDNYTEPASPQPPFEGGPWGIFSWEPVQGQWRPTANLETGSNLLNWARGFSDRFREGK